MFVPFKPHKIKIKGDKGNILYDVISIDIRTKKPEIVNIPVKKQIKSTNIENTVLFGGKENEDDDEEEIDKKASVEVMTIWLLIGNHTNGQYEWYNSQDVTYYK
jgi:hypothetical protein